MLADNHRTPVSGARRLGIADAPSVSCGRIRTLEERPHREATRVSFSTAERRARKHVASYEPGVVSSNPAGRPVLRKYGAAKNRPVASVCSAPLTIDPVGIDDNCYTLARILANEYS